MSFGKSPRQYITDKHGDLQQSVLNTLAGDDTTVVTVVSMHDGKPGQWILADTSYDKRKIARRLRLCADILDPPMSTEWKGKAFEPRAAVSSDDTINDAAERT